MTFDFHPEAEAEFEDAVAFYDDHAEDLGLDFATEVREAIERALAMPLAWAELNQGYAECWRIDFRLLCCTLRMMTACSFWR